MHSIPIGDATTGRSLYWVPYWTAAIMSFPSWTLMAFMGILMIICFLHEDFRWFYVIIHLVAAGVSFGVHGINALTYTYGHCIFNTINYYPFLCHVHLTPACCDHTHDSLQKERCRHAYEAAHMYLITVSNPPAIIVLKLL